MARVGARNAELSTVTVYVPPTFAGEGGVLRNEIVCTTLSTVTDNVSFADSQFVSPARVACTEHVIPPREAVRVVPARVQVPDWRLHDTEPLD